MVSGDILEGLNAVQRAAGVNMSVDVQVGDALVRRSDGSYAHPVFNDAVYNQVISAADGSNPRRDIVVIYVDYGQTPSTAVGNNTNGVVKIKVVNGTPAGSPTDPNDAAIQSSVGSGNPWSKLARVRVPAGQTSISNSLIDDLRSMARSKMPVGSVVDVAGATAPLGTLLCYGQAISRSTYSDLFAYLGTLYGSGDGSTTFNLPDLRGRVVAGKDDMGGSSANRLTKADATNGVNGDNLGEAGGKESHTLITAEIPSHTHSLGGGQNQWVRGGTGANPASLNQGGSAFRVEVSNPTDATGGGGTHNNVQPTIIFNKAIAY